MGHLFLRVTAHKCRCAFKTVIATPGAHLLIEQGGIKFQIHLLIELVDHFGFKHGVAPFYYSLANESDTIICYLYICKK